MREVPFVRKANDLALATSHLPQSSSASRVTAAQSGFFTLSQSGSDRSGSRSPYASIPMPAEREDSFAPLRRPRSGERAAHLTPRLQGRGDRAYPKARTPMRPETRLSFLVGPSHSSGCDEQMFGAG